MRDDENMYENKTGILKQYFGYDNFRSGQEELIDALLLGGDCLGIMPTGAGKSICYQLPALMMDGITLVISPLISLMKDQVDALQQMGISAAYLNSSLTEEQKNIVLEQARQGRYKIIYIAPERLESLSFGEFSRQANISMITVDEAHCISQWGHNFRPDYLKIRGFVDSLPRRPILSAFTATATSAVRDDIAVQLKLNRPLILVTGFNRPNLFFEVQTPAKKQEALLAFLNSRQEDYGEESGIVYCSTRKTVEEIAVFLSKKGFNACPYHAGLANEDRLKSQDAFQFDRMRIIVATKAFGMGIDKSNVRFVVHYNMPQNIESYYQEAGRAGRDGEAAHCLLLYSKQDEQTALFLIETSYEDNDSDKETLRLLKERDQNLLERMIAYCHSMECLRTFILQYFGEKPPANCGNCGNCLRSFVPEDVTETARKILSCVYRMKEKYGIALMIRVLAGSKDKRIISLGLDKLSTYGICRETRSRLRTITEYLIQNGYLRLTKDDYPVLRLEEKAAKVIRGYARVEMKTARETVTVSYKKSRLHYEVDMRLFERLSALRAEFARKQKIPAYVVFPDRSLREMCLQLPVNEREFIKISGVGMQKLDRYGKAFLQVIAEYTTQNDLPEDDF